MKNCILVYNFVLVTKATSIAPTTTPSVFCDSDDMMTDETYIENKHINIEYGGENTQTNRNKLRANSILPFELKNDSFRATINIAKGTDMPQIIGVVHLLANTNDLQNIDYIKINTPENEVAYLQTDQIIAAAENLLEQNDRLITDEAYRQKVLTTTSISIVIVKKLNSPPIKFKIDLKGCHEWFIYYYR